ncbi:MAG TPA: lysoplasmalogenase family protein [Polyangiales bacterium]|nr:lysoplasmalogenase family protein [Polyangiales bacterium]
MVFAALMWTALAVAALVLAERAHSRIGAWLAKPAASLGFIAFAWLTPHAETAYATLLLAALMLCAIGDVLLIPAGTGASFLAGTGAFALAHAAYAAAFWTRAPILWVSALAAVGMFFVARTTLRWLDPHLLPPLAAAVRGYIAVIAAMVSLAAGTSAATGDLRIAAGAVAFALSDLSVARDRFVHPGFDNLIWGLPLYYAAQLTLAWTI